MRTSSPSVIPTASSHVGRDASFLKNANSKDHHHTYFQMTSRVTWRTALMEDACPRTVAATSVSPAPVLPRPSLREQLGGGGSCQLMFEVRGPPPPRGRRDVCQGGGRIPAAPASQTRPAVRWGRPAAPGLGLPLRSEDHRAAASGLPGRPALRPCSMGFEVKWSCLLLLSSVSLVKGPLGLL